MSVKNFSFMMEIMMNISIQNSKYSNHINDAYIFLYRPLSFWQRRERYLVLIKRY